MRKKSEQQRRGPNRFRKSEARRLVQATIDAGLSVARVECNPATGKIAVIPGQPNEKTTASNNEWDEVLKNVGAKSAVGQ